LFVLNYWGEVEERGPSGTEGIVGGPFSFPTFQANSSGSNLTDPVVFGPPRDSFIAAQAFDTENINCRL
jgi:hypothetical protein